MESQERHLLGSTKSLLSRLLEKRLLWLWIEKVKRCPYSGEAFPIFADINGNIFHEFSFLVVSGHSRTAKAVLTRKAAATSIASNFDVLTEIINLPNPDLDIFIDITKKASNGLRVVAKGLVSLSDNNPPSPH